MSRLVLVSTSPRVAPGLLSEPAWAVLRSAGAVLAAPGHPLLPYLGAAEVGVSLTATADPHRLAGELLRVADAEGTAVWLVGPDGDPALGLALGAAVAGGGDVPELEMLPGSYDLPGARLIDLVATMDRLRSPGGCPWDAEQTHASLASYLVEETYETLDAIDSGDRAHLREELGDLALQVVFHARIAAEHPDAPWSVDDVAGDIVDKLVRRHPHVFGPGPDGSAEGPATASDVEAGWEVRKSAEKGRTSAVEGVPAALPALALAAKLMSRADKHGVRVPVDVGDQSIGGRLLALVAEAYDAGQDPEAELRAAARGFRDAVLRLEASR